MKQRQSVGRRVSKWTEDWVNASKRLGRMDGRMFKQLNTPHRARCSRKITPHSPPFFLTKLDDHTLDFSSFSFTLHLLHPDLLSAFYLYPPISGVVNKPVFLNEFLKWTTQVYFHALIVLCKVRDCIGGFRRLKEIACEGVSRCLNWFKEVLNKSE